MCNMIIIYNISSLREVIIANNFSFCRDYKKNCILIFEVNSKIINVNIFSSKLYEILINK